MKMPKQQELRLIGGVEARRYRAQLAALAGQGKPQVVAIKLPLEAEIPLELHEGLREANDIVRGVGTCSLFNLLVTPSLAGAKMFNAAGRTALHRNRKVMRMDVFRQAFVEAWGEQFAGMNPSDFLSYANKGRRGDITDEIDPDVIRDELYYLCGTSINALARAGKKPHAEYYDVCTRIGEMFASTFREYKAIRANVETALALMDTALSEAGLETPSLLGIHQSMQALPDPIKNSTLDFDKDDPLIYTRDEIDALGDYRLHALVAKRLREGREADESLGPYLKATITTFQFSGMAWLFNPRTGLGTLQQATREDLRAWYPEATDEGIEVLRQAVNAIPKANILQTGWHEFRASLAGSMESWMSNYLKRLESLDKTLNEISDDVPLRIPPALEKPAAQVISNAAGIDYAILKGTVDDLWARRTKAQHAVAVLYGRACEKVTPALVAELETFSAKLYLIDGYLNLIQAACEREMRIGTKMDDPARVELGLACRWTLPKEQEKDKKGEIDLEKNPIRPPWVKALEKLNRISGGSADVEGEVRRAAQRFKVVRDAAWDHHQALKDWMLGNEHTPDPLLQYEQRELAQMKRRRQNTPNRDRVAKDRALRLLLSKWLEQAQQCTESTKHTISAAMAEIGVFEDHRRLNDFLFGRKGRIYVSLYDTNRRNKPLALNLPVLRDTDWMAVMEQQLALVRDNAVSTGAVSAVKDFIRMERTFLRFIADALPARVPGEQMRNPVLLDDQYPMPSQIAIQLQADEVTHRTAVTALNHYHSMLMDVASLLFKGRFIERYALQIRGNSAPVYAPKDITWRVPERYYHSGAMADTLNTDAIKAHTRDGTIDVAAAFADLLKTKQVADESLGAYLAQAPHDWYFNLGFAGKAVFGSRATTKASSKKRKAAGMPFQYEMSKAANMSHLARIVGPSSYKNRLDQILQKGVNRVGDMTLVVEAEYQLAASLLEDGSIETRLHEPVLKPYVSIPLTDAQEYEPVSDEFYRRFVAIDLGERNIGWACFDIATQACIASGKIRLRSMLNLLRREKTGGKPHKQKFRQRFGTVLEELRENVVGDISHLVISLMAHFNAFPVFESETDLVRGSSTQLQRVYGAVLERFTYSTVPVHKTARQAFWMGGDLWNHPWAQVWKGERGKRKADRLNLFPGTSVHPSGTSQTCSCCGRNPIRALREAVDGKMHKTLHVEHGELALSDGTLVLKKKPSLSEHEMRAYKKRKLRVPLSEPVATDNYKASELLRIANINLRQPNLSLQSRDSSVSIYHCLYKDCGAVKHAEENAAINIGMKWLREKLVEPAQKAA